MLDSYARAAIAAVESAGGKISCVHYNQLGLRALLKVPFDIPLLTSSLKGSLRSLVPDFPEAPCEDGTRTLRIEGMPFIRHRLTPQAISARQRQRLLLLLCMPKTWSATRSVSRQSRQFSPLQMPLFLPPSEPHQYDLSTSHLPFCHEYLYLLSHYCIRVLLPLGCRWPFRDETLVVII
jgi:hypothetical protein